MIIRFGSLLINALYLKATFFSESEKYVEIYETTGETHMGDCTRQQYDEACEKLVRWQNQQEDRAAIDRLKEYRKYVKGGGMADEKTWEAMHNFARIIGDQWCHADMSKACKLAAFLVSKELTNDDLYAEWINLAYDGFCAGTRPDKKG